jgi:transposase
MEKHSSLISNNVSSLLSGAGTSSSPTTSRVEEAIKARGPELRLLPEYSPDLNPIEMVFHPLKALLRKAAERTVNRLERCVRSFIRGLKPSECAGYFRHCGYDPL